MHDQKKNKIVMNKKIMFLFAILIILLGLIVYSKSVNGKFIWDDDYLVKDNVYIRNWHNIPMFFTQGIGGGAGRKYSSYRPLQMVTYTLDYSLWRLNQKGYHLTNIILHILAALGIYWLINTLYQDSALSLLVSMLFIVHPIHSGAIAYISGRADPLALLFMLSCFALYIKHLRVNNIFIYILTLLSYILALLSRENSLILPALLLLYHYTFKKKLKSKEFMPLLAISIIYILLRLTLLKSLLPHLSSTSSLLQRIPGFFVAITDYIRLLVLPFGLHMEYGDKLFHLTDPKALAGVVIIFLLLMYALSKKKSNAIIFFSIFWFLAALLPVSNLYPIYAYMAEHWLYLPSVGIFLILATGLRYCLYRKKEFRIFTIIFIISLVTFYSYLTIKQNDYWKEPIPFYETTLKYAPENSRMYNNLCNAYNGIGKHQEAIALCGKAIEINPTYAEPYNNLGNAYNYLGREEEAIVSYKKAIEINPGYTEAYNNLGVANCDLGRYQEAIASYKKAIEINPNFAGSHNNLGNVYWHAGKKEEALSSYKKAIEINPDCENLYYSLGNLYNDTGKHQEAIASYKKAIEVNPNYGEAYYNLSVTYFFEKQYKPAIEYYDKAAALGFNNSALLEALKPYREQGNFNQ